MIFMTLLSGPSTSTQQGHPRAFLIAWRSALLHCHPGDAGGTDLAPVGDELRAECDILVIDLLNAGGLSWFLLLIGLTGRGGC